jgi:hypothetical protein
MMKLGVRALWDKTKAVLSKELRDNTSPLTFAVGYFILNPPGRSTPEETA